MKKGFSLIELIISLVIIFCITSAFVPLITKKFSLNVFGTGGGGFSNVTTDCADKFGENCTLCTDKYCIRCLNLTCPDDEYKDTKTCSCKKCSDTYGPDCTKCNDKKCLTCPNGEYLETSSETCKSCADKFPDCTSCDETKCTACKDGYVLDSSNPTTPCTNFECGGDDFIQIGDLCITKKNMGDGDKLTIPSGVNVVNVNQTCTPSSSNFCCWKGNTSGSNCDNENGGGYSGCNRTVCDWWAADYICKNFSAGGYTWRLGTKEEMKNWNNYSVGKNTNGLQLCNDSSGYFSAKCLSTSSCLGTLTNGCNPNYLWTGVVGSPVGAFIYYLSKENWQENHFYRTYALSVRCVTTMPQSCADKISDGCLTCSGSTCLSCDTGYILKDGKCELDCSKFGSSCSSCTTSKCTACDDGYKLSSNPSGNPACESDFCSGTDFMQIGNLCITRRNMGDSSALTIPSGVNVVNVGSACNASNANKCCWRGKTAGSCDNTNGGEYSGCNRTVCAWDAADYICKNFKAGGYTWRLATTSEMSNWANNSKGKGVNGLQLCDRYSGYSSAQCDYTYSCPGSGGNSCYPYRVWSGSTYSSGFYSYWLNSGSWSRYSDKYAYAQSVRCVTKL